MSDSKRKVLTEEQVAFFQENGYLVLNNFISPGVAEEMRKQASDWMDEFEKDTGIPIHLFTTDADQASQRTAYFQNSVRGIWPFFEEKAIDPSNKTLRYPYKQCINKIGHGTPFKPPSQYFHFAFFLGVSSCFQFEDHRMNLSMNHICNT